AVWQTKAVATRMLGVRKVLQHQSVEAQSILGELRDLKTRLSRATLESGGESTQESRLASLADLSRRKEAAERRLASAVVAPEFLVDANQLSFHELLARLPDDMAVVDIVKVLDWSTPVRRGQAAEVRSVYEAFVLTNKSGKRELEWIHLGTAAQIDEAIERWRSLLIEPESAVGGSDEDATRELVARGAVVRELLWAPLERSLGAARTVIVIPDGRVAGLPWAGLPGGKPDSFLVDQFAIGVALNARHLLESARLKTAAEVQGLLAVGISDFRSSGPEGNAVVERADDARREMAKAAQNRGWPPLEGAARQVKAIEREAPTAVDALVDSTATKSSVMAKLSMNRYALIATHGFFEPPGGPVERRPTEARIRRGANDVAAGSWEIPSVIAERNPLLACGLVFAGGEIATGEELSELDMQSVEHVLLMACDTGAGAVKDGEGAQSLQRSLALAGARNVVASLWKVDDSATEDFTRRYLRNVVDGTRSPLHSLRDAQLAQRRGQGPGISDRPRYWATWTINVDGSVFDPPSPSRIRLIAPAIALLMFVSVLLAAYRLLRKLANVSVTRGDPG
ncbi:MAG TPA: CHAT domain-containing protein, partial [Pirellulaceae bacterium]|nr:CHAT domain-containing protein [Pirellulaceae bacterium]